MKNLTLTLAIFVLTTHFIMGQNTENKSRQVKVLTFNVLHGATTKGDFNLDVIAAVIKKANPDLVALQEVDFKTKRGKNYDLATELGWRTNMVPLFVRAMHYDGGEYGEGILSKLTFISTRNIALPYSPGNEPRAAAEITTVLPSGDTISFIGTHLDHLTAAGDRISQAKKLNTLINSKSHPTILAGDLNDTPGSKTIEILKQVWTPVCSFQPTFPSDLPTEKIDWIMVYPKKRWKIIASEVICNTIASDHCALLVTLELID
jgi:endonuclease/exonuclease/phosphatase family metal-dependent hydrolase